jgi:mono/diheme cytochrome c family protein
MFTKLLRVIRTSQSLQRFAVGSVLSGLVTGDVLSLGIPAAQAQTSQVEGGKYLVNFGGCNDCHTPGYFFGRPDPKRYLGGSDVGFLVPGLGSFVGPNLTPDKETGLGNWSKQEIVRAIQTGVRPDGRVLAPVMPWRAFARLTNGDANAIVDYLRSLPPVSHKVAGPFANDEKVPIPLMQVVPPKN